MILYFWLIVFVTMTTILAIVSWHNSIALLVIMLTIGIIFAAIGLISAIINEVIE